MPSLAIFQAGIGGLNGTLKCADLLIVGDTAPTSSVGMNAVGLFPNGATSTSLFGSINGVNVLATSVFQFNADMPLGTSLFFNFSPTIRQNSGAARTLGSIYGLIVGPTISANNAAITLVDVGSIPSIVGLYFQPSLTRTGTPTSTAATAACVTVDGLVIGAGWTVTTLAGLKVNDASGAGSLTNQVALDIANLAKGTANLSLRSVGAAVEMRHNGPIALGTAWPWLKIDSLAAPGTPVVTNIGTAGATTYSYTVTAVTTIPTAGLGETVASSVGTTTTGNVTLDSTNFNRLIWASSPGAIKYNIYRTVGGASTGKIGTYDVFTGGAQRFDDTGLAGSGASPSTNTTGALHVNAGLSYKRTVTSDADYTALLTDLIIEMPAITAARIVNLPAASTATGKLYIIKKTTGTFTVTIDASGAELIDAATTLVLGTADYLVASIYCTGTKWLSF